MAVIVWTLQWRYNGRDGVSNHRCLHCLLNCWFSGSSKKTPKLRVIGLCERISPVTGEFPAQKASNAENISIWWSHHEGVDPRLNQRIFCCVWLPAHRCAQNFSVGLTTHKNIRQISQKLDQIGPCWVHFLPCNVTYAYNSHDSCHKKVASNYASVQFSPDTCIYPTDTCGARKCSNLP